MRTTTKTIVPDALELVGMRRPLSLVAIERRRDTELQWGYVAGVELMAIDLRTVRHDYRVLRRNFRVPAVVARSVVVGAAISGTRGRYVL